MHALIAAALDDAHPLAAGRSWRSPNERALIEAERVLFLVIRRWPTPAVRVEPSGAITFEWDAAERGWLELTVDGSATLTHSAVLAGDDYGKTETFPDPDEAERLPDWAAELLHRLYSTLQ
jgi:hypothetical protein